MRSNFNMLLNVRKVRYNAILGNDKSDMVE